MTTTPSHPSVPSTFPDREHLRADCERCFALCCTAFGFTRSVDFAEDKPAGSPCRHLAPTFACTIHDGLRGRGFRGCTVFDCFGAGQAVSQRLFGGRNRLDDAATKQQMFAAFAVVRHLHEMLWYLDEARSRTHDPDMSAVAGALVSRIDALTRGAVAELLSVDTTVLHTEVGTVLVDVSAEVRASYFAAGAHHLDPSLVPGADLAGRDLSSGSLCGADLRGACLIAADLRGSDLTATDLLGADLRDARLDGADLAAALFVTRPQINAARGSAETRLPPGISTPPHWYPRR